MTFGAHLFAAAVTLPALMFIVILLRRGQLRTKYAMLWLPVGLVILVFGLFPGLLDAVSNFVGIAYPPTILLVAAIGLLLMVCIHFSWELSRLEERVRLIVERIALDNVTEAGSPERGSVSR